MTVRPFIRINIVSQRTPHSTEYVLYIVKGKCGMPDISRARDDDKDNAAWASSIYIYIDTYLRMSVPPIVTPVHVGAWMMFR